jgi:acyl transferase domain-containing protein
MSESGEFHDGIAIVGMAGRFPQSPDVTAFWENLRAGKECLTEFSEDEIVAAGVARKSLSGSRVRARGVLERSEYFDAAFFSYSPREAEVMDPQQRVLLEIAWSALEDAGYDPERPPGPIGVFAGSGINTYFPNNVARNPDVLEAFGMFPAVVLNEKDFAATRIAYKLNLKGPAITVQTACSTSLVAVCNACQSLLNYECDMALAGAAAVVSPTCHSCIHEEGGMIAPDGHCRPFDAKASGTLFSDGAGIVVLRRLEDAIKANDHILAVIKGFAVNNDGSGKVGFTAPSVEGQAEVVRMAQEFGETPAGSISYVEAHGTATPLGDPIEIAALTQAFRQHTQETQFCAIGSVKSNIGHLDAAAGVAGLIKTTLALQHGYIPPTLHFQSANPQISFKKSPFYVVDRLQKWERTTTPRRAGVSSFGIGGTNAHVVVQEAPLVPEPALRPAGPQLLLLSAKTPTALEAATGNLTAFLAKRRNLDLRDVAHTLQLGRRQFNCRRTIVCDDIADALSVGNDRARLEEATSVTRRFNSPVAFTFSGQGSQYADMGRDLYENEPRFRVWFDRCADGLKSYISEDLRSIVFPEASQKEDSTQLLAETRITQPALFALEYSLAMLWREWGVEPAAFAGHSIGEYVAACLADVFTLEDALRLVSVRGRLMQSMPRGSMLAVSLTEQEVQTWLNERLSLAAVNASASCVVSGSDEAIEDLERSLSRTNVQCRQLRTSHAFHSMMMDPILARFEEEVGKAQPQEPRIPFASNVTGRWIKPDEATDPAYWAKHLRSAVRFADCLARLFEEPQRIVLEVGPGRTLTTLAKMHPAKSRETVVLSSTRHPTERRSDVSFALDALGRMWRAGVEVDWQAFRDGQGGRRVSLPTYPFESKRYWLEIPTARLQAPTKPETAPSDLAAASNPVGAGSPAPVGRPRADIEQRVAAIWTNLLGVHPIAPDDDFFEIGGSSLLAARVFAQIDKEFGRLLPLSTLFEAPTVRKLAVLLSPVETETSPKSQSLVQLREGGTAPPLFLIHAEGGNVLGYRNIVKHLPNEQPLFALQAQGLTDGLEPRSTVEELATAYLREIRSVQPEGPYYLGGWCLGGMVAYEMAQQLSEAGEEPALLVMIQTRHIEYCEYPAGTSALRRVSWAVQDRAKYQLDCLWNAESKTMYLQGSVHRAYTILRERIDRFVRRTRGRAENATSIASRIEVVSTAHNAAYWNYRPQPYGGPVLAFYASEQPAGFAEDVTLGWKGLITGEFENHEIRGFHQQMLWNKQAQAIADILTRKLNQTRRERRKEVGDEALKCRSVVA